MEIISIILGVTAGVAVLALLFKSFFGGRYSFIDCVKAFCWPILGEYFQDIWHTFKLSLWIFLGFIAGYGVYTGLMKLFG